MRSIVRFAHISIDFMVPFTIIMIKGRGPLEWIKFINSKGYGSTHQVEVACGMGPGQLSAYLNGQYKPENMRAATLSKLMGVLGATDTEICEVIRAEVQRRRTTSVPHTVDQSSHGEVAASE